MHAGVNEFGETVRIADGVEFAVSRCRVEGGRCVPADAWTTQYSCATTYSLQWALQAAAHEPVKVVLVCTIHVDTTCLQVAKVLLPSGCQCRFNNTEHL